MKKIAISGIFALLFVTFWIPAAQAQSPTIDGCLIYPADNIWNVPVDKLPLDPKSASYIKSIDSGGNHNLHPDFGQGVWPPGSNAPIGIPYISVPDSEPLIDINFIWFGDESDPGPYPIPLNAPIEGGPDSDGDRHVLSLEHTNCLLYELYFATPNGGQWDAGSGSIYDLTVNGPFRTDGFTSADAAGLPILPGLIRYDEVNAGVIRHAIRFTSPVSQNKHIWPARHDAGDANSKFPPMGARLRLKENFDISGFSPSVQVILQALKTYGMILADNGSGWYLSGEPNENWDNDTLVPELSDVPGTAFEVVDTSVLMIDYDSGQAATWPPASLFSDNFNDNDILDWTPNQGTWGPSGDGSMTASTVKKGENFPQLFAAGCTDCLIEGDLQLDTAGNRISLLAWRADSKHYVELALMDDVNKVQVKMQNGSNVVKKSVAFPITAGVKYHVKLRYVNNKIVGEVPGLAPIVITPSATPAGTVGYRIKSVTGGTVNGRFDSIVVY